MKRALLPFGLLLALHAPLPAQENAAAPQAPRAALAAGMGVEYIAAPDVTDLVNGNALPSARAPQFRAAVEFFGACAIPVADRWMLKLELAYDLSSYSVDGAFGPASWSMHWTMPSIILQYVLVDRGIYNVRAGAGGGYHFGGLAEKYLSLDDTFTGSGPGALLELEANTAFGDHLYAFLGANLRWEFVGTLTDARGVSPGIASGGAPATLHAFGAGARLGASYLF